GLVDEARVERHLRAEILVEADLAQHARRVLRGEHRESGEEDHRLPSFRAGKPSFSTSSIARSIGTCTMPADGSIQPYVESRSFSFARSAARSTPGVVCSRGSGSASCCGASG